MRTYSLDLRDRVVAACDEGELLREEIADEFGVSVSWIRRLLQRRRETVNYGPKKTKRGRKSVFSAEALQRLDKLVEAQSDATLEELRERSGISCSLMTVSNALGRLGYHRKKRPSGLLSKTAKM